MGQRGFEWGRGAFVATKRTPRAVSRSGKAMGLLCFHQLREAEMRVGPASTVSFNAENQMLEASSVDSGSRVSIWFFGYSKECDLRLKISSGNLLFAVVTLSPFFTPEWQRSFHCIILPILLPPIETKQSESPLRFRLRCSCMKSHDGPLIKPREAHRLFSTRNTFIVP